MCHGFVILTCESGYMQQDATDLLVEDLPGNRPQLRVAVVTETYPPEINGVSLSLKKVVDGLRERGHQVQLVRPRQPKSDAGVMREPAVADAAAGTNQDVLLRGMPIPRYPNLQLGLPSRKRLEPLWTLKRPDVVHIATEGPLGWSALKVARKLKIPVTSDFRTNFHSYSSHYGVGWLSKPIMAYLKRFHNQTACTMVPTASLSKRLSDAGFLRLKVVPRGVDLQRFDPAHRSETLRASWGAKPDTPVIMCVSRLASEKNLQLLVRAYAQAKLVRPDVKLVLVGDGPARAELKGLAPDAIFAGVQTGQALSEYYASADIFGFPSQTETFGNVVLEGMSSGLAVVAFDYAAAAETIQHGQNGLLARLNDDEGFVQRVVELTVEPDRVQRLRQAGRLTVQSWDWQQIVAQVESVMLQALAVP